jgi:HEAT repeat protein
MWPARRYEPEGQAIFRDLEASDHRVRVRALQALGRMEHPSELTWSALDRALGDSHPKVRIAAACCAADLGHHGAVDRLVAMIEDSDIDVRLTAVGALGTIGEKRAASAVARVLRSEIGQLRYQAAISLAEIKGEDAGPELAGLLDDPEAQVRWAAVAALGDVECDGYRDEVASCLSDDDETVRFEAALTLARLKDGRGVDVLGQNVTHRERAYPVCEVLGSLRDERARPYLRKAWKRVWLHPLTRMRAAASLAMLRDEEAFDFLAKKAVSRRRFIREAALELLAEVGGDECLKILVGALGDPRVTGVAAGALGKLGDERAVEPLEEIWPRMEKGSEEEGAVREALLRLEADSVSRSDRDPKKSTNGG